MTNVLSTPDTPAALDAAGFRALIGHFASGVTVITSELDGVRYGTTASAVSSLCAEPPMLLVCLHRGSETGRAIERSGRFAVNILRADQHHLARHFAVSGPDLFGDVATTPGAGGQPLLDGVLAHVECRVAERAAGGTHTVLFAHVDTGRAHGGEPLTYFRGRFGGFAEVTS